MDYNGVPLRNKDGPVYIAPRASILQHGWIAFHAAMRMDALHTAAKALIYYAHRPSILQHGWIAFHAAMRMVALHTAATALICYAHRASILQRGWITTAFHSATRMDPFTSPTRASILQHGWITAALHSAQGRTRLHRPSGIHSATRMDCVPRRNEDGRASHRRNGTHLLRPSGIHSATRMDYNGVPLRNKDGPVYIAPRASILQHGWIVFHSATRMDTLFTSPQRHSFTTPFGHPFCNTDRLRSTP